MCWNKNSSLDLDSPKDADGRSVCEGECREFVFVRAARSIVHGRYQNQHLCIHAEEGEVYAWHRGQREREREAGSPLQGNPAAERKPCPNVQLTLSVSFKHFIRCVKHLSLWGLWRCGREGGKEGGRGKQVNWQVSSPWKQQFTFHHPPPPQRDTFKSISENEGPATTLLQLTPQNSIRHEKNEFNEHQFIKNYHFQLSRDFFFSLLLIVGANFFQSWVQCALTWYMIIDMWRLITMTLITCNS